MQIVHNCNVMRIASGKDLGAVIKEARLKRGISQSDLAETVSVDQSIISRVERGYPGTRIGIILRILKALKLSIGVGEEDEVAPPSSTKRAKADYFDLDAIANTGLKNTGLKK